MSLAARQKRRRQRLTLIGAVVFVIVGLVVGRYLMVKGGTPSQPADQFATDDERRAAGLAAYAKGDDELAAEQLQPYVEQHAGDAEAVFALAEANRRLSEDNPALLVNAVDLYRQVLELEPQRHDVARTLLSILIRHPDSVESEALNLADRLLRFDENDPLALRAQVVCLAQVGRGEEAIAAAEKFLDANPTDVAMRLRFLDLLHQQNHPASELMDRTEALRTRYPDDPRFQLVEAYVRLLVDDREAALGWLERSGESAPPDAAFVTERVRVMDRAQLFPDVVTYLDELVAKDAALVDHDELARRRFEVGLILEAHEAMQQVEHPSIALRTMDVVALLRLGRTQQANDEITRIEKLAGRVADTTAKFLRVCASPGHTPADLIRTGRAALDAGARNPYLDLILAEAYERSGQLEAARARYEAALSQRPTWAAPFLKLSQLTLATDDAPLAARYAEAAVRRQPQNLEARVALAEGLGAQPARLDRRQRNDLFELIDQIQEVVPGEPRTLQLRVELLARGGDSAGASQAALGALQLSPPLNESAMLSLIDATRRLSLDAEGPLQVAYVKRFGATLEITMLRATQIAQDGDADGALALYDAATPDEQPAAWRVNRALLLERLGKPEAAGAWAAVGDALPGNLVVQQSILGSAAAWRDRPLIERTINRLRKITGDADAAWRLERARWLLADDDPTRHADEINTVLEPVPDSSTALRMRAHAQRQLGDGEQAAALLEEAVTLAPSDADARLELADLQRASGKTQTAHDNAQSVAADEHLTDAQVRRATQLLIDLGDIRQATATLARLTDSRRATPQDLFTLAQLYQRDARVPDALQLIDGFLATPTPASVAFAADLYARTEQTKKAEQTLALLDTLGLPAEQAQTIRAAHLAAHGSAGEAEAAFAAVAEADPTHAAGWHNLVAFQFRAGRTAEALATARAALPQVPGDAGLAAVVKQADAIEALADEPGVAAFTLSLLIEETNRPVAARVIDAVADAKRRGDDGFGPLVDELDALAAEHPGYEALQVLAVTTQLKAGRYAAGLKHAEALMRRFPDSARAARLSAEAEASVGRWGPALIAAEAWAERTPGDRLAPHALMARGHRELDRPAIAVRLLEPYEKRLATDPFENADATKQWALALAATGQSRESRAVLEPLLSKGVTWRMAMLDAAVLSVPGTKLAGSWLESVEAAVPEDAWAEQASLAQAWWTLGRRDSYRAYLERGRDLAEVLAKAPQADADIWFFLGTVYEAERDLSQAEAAYRKAIALDPETIFARNNLAMVMADHGGDLAEAEALVDRAIAARPEEPNFHDTRAYVLMRAGHYDKAEAAIRRALELDPGQPQWQVRLNEITSLRQSSAQ